MLYRGSAVLLLLLSVSLMVGGALGTNIEISYALMEGTTMLLFIDPLGSFFFSVVSLIASSVIYYSGSYMSGDKEGDRFLYLVLFFVTSMFFVVFSLNLVSILLGWDGLGLTSYVLVVYYHSGASNAAGMITALSNRIGDVAILLAIGTISEWGSWSFMTSMDEWDYSYVTGMGVLVILASITKSAQIPFSAWLPAAMAAPTPVSALVHSSTLVAAGVYLLIRFYPVVSHWGTWLMGIALITTFMASLSAIQEVDSKKVVALSTLSQLGVMIGAIGAGLPELAFFHLLTHALFKALLFMCAGKIIHEVGGTQDVRAMGGVSASLPYTVSCLNVANMALCGIPFLAGFYSKDLLVELEVGSWEGWLTILLIGMSVGLSSMYSVRLTYMSVVVSSLQSPLGSVSDSDSVMIWSKTLLTVGSIMGGSMMAWMIFPSPPVSMLTMDLKWMALEMVLAGSVSGVMVSLMSILWGSSIEGFAQMWFLPFLSGHFISWLGLTSTEKAKSLDKGWLEEMGAQGVYEGSMKSSMALMEGQMSGLKLFLTSFGVLLMVVVVIS